MARNYSQHLFGCYKHSTILVSLMTRTKLSSGGPKLNAPQSPLAIDVHELKAER